MESVVEECLWDSVVKGLGEGEGKICRVLENEDCAVLVSDGCWHARSRFGCLGASGWLVEKSENDV